jgi:steroid delta-isomerase-like uncharacterized protein
MSTEDNKALVRDWFTEIDKGEAADFDRFLAIDYADHNPPPIRTEASGRAGVKEYSATFRAAIDDFRHVVEEQIAEGDRVVSRITASGTHTGELLGIPPTGRRVRMAGVAIHRIASGKLVEHWAQIDLLGLLQQLGAVPVLLPGPR